MKKQIQTLVVMRQKEGEQPELKKKKMKVEIVEIDGMDFIKFNCPDCGTEFLLPVCMLKEIASRKATVDRRMVS